MFTVTRPPVELNLSFLYLNCCVFMPLLYKIRRPYFNLFDPIYIYSYIFYFFYVLSSIVVYNSDNNWESSLVVNIYQYGTVITLNIFLGLSILMFYCGYFYITRNIKFDIHLFDKIPKLKGENFLLCLYFFSAIFRIYGYATGHMGSLTGAQERGFNFPGMSILMFLSNIWFVYYSYFTIRCFFAGEHKQLWLFFTLVELLIVMVGGDRRYIVEIALIISSVYYFKKKMLPWTIILIGLFVFVFVFIPITSLYGYLLGTTNGSLSESVGLMNTVIDRLISMSPTEVIQDYILYPLFSQSFFQIPVVQTAYEFYDQKGIHWGPIPLQFLANQVLPAFLFERMDVRVYINAFGLVAKTYDQGYSSMTFFLPQEIIVCYGLKVLPFLYVLYGLLVGWIYKVLISGKGFTKVLYIASIFCMCYCFHSGFFATELTTPLRVLIYYGIYKLITNNTSSKQSLSVL